VANPVYYAAPETEVFVDEYEPVAASVWQSPAVEESYAPVALEETVAVAPVAEVAAAKPAPVVSKPNLADSALALQMAPLNRRVMATLVDSSLTMLAFLGVVMVAGSHMSQLPTLSTMGVGAVLVLLVIGSLYQFFFLMFTGATPGMNYANIRLTTFDEKTPAPQHLLNRFCTQSLSLLPLGGGFLWAIFDKNQLTWHDRFSKTYQRHTW